MFNNYIIKYINNIFNIIIYYSNTKINNKINSINIIYETLRYI